ncbi:MAG: Hsp20 family protein [Gammaproteobacteria bacterium]|jgi:HSP20 family molecular chaperone IbpA
MRIKQFNHRSFLWRSLITLLGIGFAVQSYQVYRLDRKISELQGAENVTPSATPSTARPFDPWGSGAGGDPFTNMQQQMDALFGSLLQDSRALPSSGLRASAAPTIEVSETDREYRVVIEVPENGELELSTDIEDNTVRVAGSIVYTAPGSFAATFSSRSQFSRSIPLSDPVDPLAMRTDKNAQGIVITIPKV